MTQSHTTDTASEQSNVAETGANWNPADAVPVMRLSDQIHSFAELTDHVRGFIEGGNVWSSARARTRQALYVALSNVYDYFLQLEKAKDDKLKEMRRAIKEIIKERFAEAYHDSRQFDTMLVALVIGEDKRKVSQYVKVLRKAAKAGAESGYLTDHVPVDDFADWIKRNSGITAVANNSGTAKSAGNREETATELVGMPPVETVTVSNYSALDKNFEGTPVVLLGVYLGNGQFAVKGFVKSAAASNAALDAFRTENKSRFAS